MARPRHWLDPLARRLLQATGELPSPPKPLKPVTPLVLDTPPVDTWQIDVNRASQSDWLKLPGCTQIKPICWCGCNGAGCNSAALMT